MGVEKTGSQINVRHVDSSKSFIVTDLSKELQGAMQIPSRHSQQLQKIGVFRSRKITDKNFLTKTLSPSLWVCHYPRPKMVTNSFGNKSFMWPMRRLSMHS
jgi:hypothetical protein